MINLPTKQTLTKHFFILTPCPPSPKVGLFGYFFQESGGVAENLNLRDLYDILKRINTGVKGFEEKDGKEIDKARKSNSHYFCS